MKQKNTNRTIIIILLAIFLLALGLRGLYFLKEKDNMSLTSDPRNYWLMSHQIVDNGIYGYWYDGNPYGGNPGISNARVMPGYPLFLAAVYKVVGDKFLQITAVRLLQIIAGSLSVLVAFAFVKKAFKKEGMALLAAFFVAVYPSYILSCMQILTEILALFTMLIYFYLAALAFESRKTVHNLLAGVAFGLHILIRPTLLPLFILPFMFIILNNLFNRKKSQGGFPLKLLFKLFLMQLIGFVAVMAPWWIRNFVVLGTFIITAKASGNPLLAGTYPYFQDYLKDVTDSIRGNNEKQQALGIQRIINGLKTDPWLYIKWFTFGKTELLFWKPFLHHVVSPAYKDMYFFSHFFVLYSGILGMIWHAIKSSRALWFYVYGLAILCLQLLFVPDSRFAYLIMFFIMVGAAHLLCSLAELFSTKILKRVHTDNT